MQPPEAMRRPRILLVMLEFASWQRARAWGYSGNFGVEEGLRAAGAECVVLPALHEVPSTSEHSWLAHARQTFAGEHFDQVWVWLVHHEYDPAFWDWVHSLAPVVVGLVFESLEHSPEEISRFPQFARRQRFVEQQLQRVTHALAVDERDVAHIEERGLAPARWLPTAVPRRCIDAGDEQPSELLAVFHGAAYGQRRGWLEEPTLAGLLVHGGDAEAGTTIGERHEAVHLAACEYLAAGRSPSRAVLQAYVDACRAVRREAFDHWLQHLRRWPVSVNLPSIGKIYPSRVMEAMAAGRPVVSWRIPERPRNLALFEPGREILLYDTPRQLAAQIEGVLADPGRGAELARAARQRLWTAHTVEEQSADLLAWIDGRARHGDVAADTLEQFERAMGGAIVALTPAQRMQTALGQIASAERCASQGQLPRAIQIVEAVGEQEPGIVGVHRLLARLSAEQGQGWRATRAFERGLALHPQALELIVPALEHVVSEGDVDRALQLAARGYRQAHDDSTLVAVARGLDRVAQLLRDEVQQQQGDAQDAARKGAADYRLPAGYRAREMVAHHDDRGFSDEWQDEVYRRARRELDARGGHSVLDIGCGSGFKLLKHFSHCETVGMELSPAYEHLLRRYPDRSWIKSSFARPLRRPVDLVIVSDVIEHLADPDRLLGFLASFGWQVAVISTPDRELLGSGAAGPPLNPCHVREWSFTEFGAYLGRRFTVVDQEVCNREQATQLVVLEQRPRTRVAGDAAPRGLAAHA